MRRIHTKVLILASVAIMISGCGQVREAAQRTQRSNDFKQLGLLYYNYYDMNQKGPSQAADLDSLASSDPDAQAALQALKSGQYVLLWDVKFSELTEGTSNTVLGYESTVPTAGGNVLMADGSIRQMTAEEFAAAPKAN